MPPKNAILRHRRGSGFIYIYKDGSRIRDPKLITRIQKLAIPPAYKDVWIDSNPHAPLQAQGTDARGRKQYRYHAKFREQQEAKKFDRLKTFGKALPKIRRRINQDLHGNKLDRQRVLATVISVLEKTLIRVGNDEYVKQNGSFGLTTLKDRHVAIKGSKVQFNFPGKSHVFHHIDLEDPLLASTIKKCRDLPGSELFQYLDSDGNSHRLHAHDVNQYLQEVSGLSVTTKDYRTFFGSVRCLELLFEQSKICAEKCLKQTRGHWLEIVKEVSDHLGNTPTVCRKSYLHPRLESLHAKQKLKPTHVRKNYEKEFLNLLEKKS